MVSAAGWSRASIVDGQRELERLHREVDAAFAALVIADGGDDRDAAARLARAVGVSTRCARERVRVARICDAVPAAHSALPAGALCSERVALLGPVVDDPSVDELVEVGSVNHRKSIVTRSCGTGWRKTRPMFVDDSSNATAYGWSRQKRCPKPNPDTG